MVEGWAAREPDVTFAIVPADTGSPAGVATLCRLDPAHGSAEVGAILYARSLQRTRAATEAIHLLAAYLFDELGYRRFEWKLDAPQRAVRAGRAPAGLLLRGPLPQRAGLQGPQPRHRLVRDDRRRLAAVRAAHRRWLDPANFDAHGRQRTSLSVRPWSSSERSERVETRDRRRRVAG